MADVLRTGIAVRDEEVVIERPDGSCIFAVVSIDPLEDAAGRIAGAINCFRDITGHRPARPSPAARDAIVLPQEGGEPRYREIFENARVAVWEEDFSAVVAMLDELRAEGVEDLRGYLQARPDRLAEAIRRVRVNDVNGYAVELYEADRKETLLRSLADVFFPETEPVFVEELLALWEGRRRFESEAVARTLTGRRLDVILTMAFEGERCERTLVSMLDISAQKAAERALRAQTRRLETLNRAARSISGNLELDAVVQTATDMATELSGAQFGAFFYNVADDDGGHYLLYTLSGASGAAFERFGLPRKTAVFEPMFRGTGVVRSDDIRNDPRYGQNQPHHGMPEGHLPVASYLAVPVVSRSGEVHGGLFFGHRDPGVFTEASEDLVSAIAAHAAIAIDNTRLHSAAQAEIQERRRAEQVGPHLASIVESSDVAIVSQDLDGIIGSWNSAAEQLFGYGADEAVGRPITMLLPADRKDEEAGLFERVQRGECVDQYETVRRRKDGSLVDISLTVSPIRSGDEVVGASQIARDNTERRRAQEQQTLLIREMHHRVRNLFAVASSVVALSSRCARTAEEVAEAIHGRLGALARAHELTMPHITLAEETPDPVTTLHELTREILSPYLDPAAGADPPVVIEGPEIRIGGSAITNLALLLHEFATNAAKHGALSCPKGRVRVAWSAQDEDLLLTWREQGAPRLEEPAQSEGFGSLLVRGTVQGQFGGRIWRDWSADGLTMTLTLPLARLTG
jgi:PAS domain S-box-containing protein